MNILLYSWMWIYVSICIRAFRNESCCSDTVNFHIYVGKVGKKSISNDQDQLLVLKHTFVNFLAKLPLGQLI